MSSDPRTLPELSFRARKILYAVVAEYIATAEPVGSRRLARRYGLNLSPASIRNVLADLEDACLLTQPHTSAGRVPTDLGFRVFVDALVQMREVTAEDRAAIVGRMRALTPERDDVMRETGRLLSTLTGAATVVAPPRPDEVVLSQIRFVPLGDNRVLAVLVTRSGVVQNRVVRVDEPPDPASLDRLHNYLTDLVGGRTLGQVREALAREMASERGHYLSLGKLDKQVVEGTFAVTEAPRVHIEGQELLFGRPEFSDAGKIRAFLRTFEEREHLLDLLDRTLVAGGVQVLIGAEADLEDIEDVSVISASYRTTGGGTGTLGVIGPARMDYEKVVPLVEFTARTMGRVLADEDVEDQSSDGD